MLYNTSNPQPFHPQVDWSTKTAKVTDATVEVTCPEIECGSRRHVRAGAVALAIRRGKFTGRCLKHRELRGPRLGDYQPAPGVDYSKVRMLLARGGRERMSHVLSVCTQCGAERWKIPSVIQSQLRAGRFTGLCLRCSTREMLHRTTDGRHIGSKGYVVIASKRALPEELHDAYDMVASTRRTVRQRIFEHTIVMAHRLGRPLRKDETVHHCNGKRADNRPKNLRLYKRGEHHPGYGDFYQEWQEALADIAKLKATH